MRIEAVVVMLLAVLVVLFVVFPKPAPVVTETAAKNFVLEDMQTKYPHADEWEILSVEHNTTTSDGKPSYAIKGAVVLNLKSVCPERYHLYYDYPKSNFVTWTETIASHCEVCRGQSSCVIAFPEEAVIASYKLSGSTRVSDYITSYPDAKPTVQFLDSTEDGMTNVWRVQWISPGATYSLVAFVSKANGSVLKVTSA